MWCSYLLYRNRCRSVHISCKRNSSKTDGLIFRNYTAVVHNLKMCIKEDNPGLNIFKGDH